MATRTEVNTETSTQDPNLSYQSQIPHNSGFSAYTPEGRWQDRSRDRHNSESPTQNPFRGEGRMLRSSSALPSSRNDEEKEGRGTPGTPRIPTSQLPTPGPTGPRRQRLDQETNDEEPRNYQNLRREVHSVEPGYAFQGQTYVPESILEEADGQEIVTEAPRDPRSPQGHRTPIPSSPQQEFGPTILNLTPRTNPQTPRPSRSPESSSGSSIRITQPLGPRDQVIFPPSPRRSPPVPPIDTRTYRSQYESAMGSALDRQPATNSSQPKRYPTPQDALEDVGTQCRDLGEVLGVRRIENLSLGDHIQAVRALAEAREADLPIWAASRIREVNLNRELNRLYAIVRQPDVALIVPEDPSLPDPWGLTRNQLSPAATPVLWSWQQLEQQRAFESERECWREHMANEVRRRAEAVIRPKEDFEETRSHRSFNLASDPITRPPNPAVPSTTVYPSSSVTDSNWARPTVKIIEPSSDDSSLNVPPGQEFQGYSYREPQFNSNSPSNRNAQGEESKREFKSSESQTNTKGMEGQGYKTVPQRDAPPHQTPAQTYLKPGDFRPSGYKYTPYPRNSNAVTSHFYGSRLEIRY
ncbi:hypothetical protein K435DRAFT_810244 [Dendrothele bispora CBS 962.96]|uniref:Uncharacterized protein n=1 Tax=Dendrothele bispora (strain CBS 962.96) TaxID=1314807 RepID=A0A4V4HBM5_DENBC|nr:hypothetical protein K435DRAFT_810244 [Dendrothele bispora CBS 962.96]